MHIRQIKLNELLSFVNSGEVKKSNVLPISEMRAKSQVLNPRAQPDDILLTVAFNDAGNIIAYVGALPDISSDGVKIAWNSCWFSDLKDGKTIALPLFLQFVKNYNSKVIFQDLTPHTTQIVKTLPYFDFVQEKIGVRLYMRSVLSVLLPQKIAFTKHFKFLFALTDSAFNLFFDFRWKHWVRRKNSNLTYTKIDFIDEETAGFIEKYNKNEFSKRGREDLNWILKNNWLVEKSEISSEQKQYFKKKYHFSAVTNRFRYHLLKIKSGEELVAFIFLRQRDRAIETPYIYMADGVQQDVAKLLLKFACQERMSVLTTFNDSLTQSLMELKSPILLKRELKRDIVASKELIKELGVIGEIQDGDGDVVFS